MASEFQGQTGRRRAEERLRRRRPSDGVQRRPGPAQPSIATSTVSASGKNMPITFVNEVGTWRYPARQRRRCSQLSAESDHVRQRPTVLPLVAFAFSAVIGVCGMRQPPTSGRARSSTAAVTAPAGPVSSPLPPPEALTDVLARLSDPTVAGADKIDLVELATADDAAALDKFGQRTCRQRRPAADVRRHRPEVVGNRGGQRRGDGERHHRQPAAGQVLAFRWSSPRSATSGN